MNDSFACPHCQRRLVLPAHLVGQEVRCPGCDTAFRCAVDLARPSADAQGIQAAPGRPATITGEPDRPARPSLDRKDEDDLRGGFRRADRPDVLPGGAVATAVVVLLILSAVWEAITLLVSVIPGGLEEMLGPF